MTDKGGGPISSSREDNTNRMLEVMMSKMEQISLRLESQAQDIAEMKGQSQKGTSVQGDEDVQIGEKDLEQPVLGRQREDAGDLMRTRSGLHPQLQHGIRAPSSLHASPFTHQGRTEAYKVVFKLEDSKDYYVWSFSMKKFLESEHLDELVFGKLLKPTIPDIFAPKSEVQSYLEWEEKNSVAERAIMSCVGKSQMALLTMCKSSSEMWMRLKRTYAQSDETNILRLQGELQGVTWKRSSTLESYIKEIDNLANQLRCCGEDISDRTLRLVTLKGLPDKYEFIKHIILQQENLSYTEICDKLRSHVGLSLMNTTSAGTMSSFANLSTSQLRPRIPPSRPARLMCDHCKKGGHEANMCWKKNPHLRICSTCKGTGHHESDCPKKNGEKQRHATLASAHVSMKEDPQANMAKVDVEWIVDSGATHHMCNQQDNFSTIREMEGNTEISLGDSSKLGINLEGTVELNLKHTKGFTECDLKDVLCVPNMARNLFSVTTCMKQGNNVIFNSEKMECKITNRRGVQIGRAHLKNGL
jgi:gag-polypeptide of LTR copia-type